MFAELLYQDAIKDRCLTTIRQELRAAKIAIRRIPPQDGGARRRRSADRYVSFPIFGELYDASGERIFILRREQTEWCAYGPLPFSIGHKLWSEKVNISFTERTPDDFVLLCKLQDQEALNRFVRALRKEGIVARTRRTRARAQYAHAC